MSENSQKNPPSVVVVYVHQPLTIHLLAFLYPYLKSPLHFQMLSFAYLFMRSRRTFLLGLVPHNFLTSTLSKPHGFLVL
jgi:hypothetical protein